MSHLPTPTLATPTLAIASTTPRLNQWYCVAGSGLVFEVFGFDKVTGIIDTQDYAGFVDEIHMSAWKRLAPQEIPIPAEFLSNDEFPDSDDDQAIAA